MFLTGMTGFAAASAVGGAAVNFPMLISARAVQGAFAALLAPTSLSLLATTFTNADERRRSFAVYGAVAGSGGAVGLVLGGILTEYLSWRWCLYVNVLFAAAAGIGAAVLLGRDVPGRRPRVDVAGAALVSGGMFSIVYGFSNAATHTWGTPSTWAFIAPESWRWPRSCGGRRARPSRCCRCGSWPTATGPGPTWRCCSPARACSGSCCS